MRHVTHSLALMVALTAVPQLLAAEATETPVGLGGYCAVCIVDGNQWVKGSPEFSHEFDGRVYYFPEAGARDKFVASPEKYVPALNGDCIVCYQAHDVRNPGKVQFTARHKGRIYLFPDAGIRDMFVATPEKFENSDLAADGKCIVCKVKANHDVMGKTEFTAVHDGFRYLFPSDKERQVFLKSPGEFVMKPNGAVMAPQGANVQLVNFTGKTECAACNYGIRPIGEPGDLGLAVKTALGEIYVIEGASQQYPKIYKDRYDGLSVAVSGKVVAEKNGYKWIEPTALEQL